MVAFATLFAFTACEDTPADEGVDGTPTKCSKPSLKVTEKGDDYFTVEWKTVAGAASYFVDCGGNTQSVTEPKVTYTDVAPGEYVVRVMAVAGEGYTDSDYAEIKVKVTPKDTKDWFTQTVELREDAEDGITKSNAIYTTWKGTGLVSIKSGVFPAAQSSSLSEADLASYLQAVKDEYIAAANSEEGCTLVWGPLDAATEWEVVSIAENEFGYTLVQRHTIATEAAPMADYVAQWLGTWEVTADKTVEYYQYEDEVTGMEYLGDRVLEEPYSMTWEIKHYPVYSDAVVINGVSRVFPEDDFPALARVLEGGKLELVAGIQVAGDQGGYAPMWVPTFAVAEMDMYRVPVYIPFYDFGVDENGELNYFAAYTFTLDGTTAVSAPGEMPLTATDNETGEKTEVTGIVDSFDIYAVGQQGVATYGNFSEGETTKVNTGTMTMVKSQAAPAISAKMVGEKKNIVLMPFKKSNKCEFTY